MTRGNEFFCRAFPFLITLGTCGDEQFSTMVTKMRGMSIQWVVMAMPEKTGGWFSQFFEMMVRRR